MVIADGAATSLAATSLAASLRAERDGLSSCAGEFMRALAGSARAGDVSGVRALHSTSLACQSDPKHIGLHSHKSVLLTSIEEVMRKKVEFEKESEQRV